MDIIFFIIGLIVLIVGKLRVYGKKTLRGSWARVSGLVLMAPLIFSFASGFLIGLANRGHISPEQLQSVTGLECLMLPVTLLVVVAISITAPNPITTTSALALPDLLTPTEAAHYLRTSEGEVQNLIKQGALTTVTIGSKNLINKQSVLNLVQQGAPLKDILPDIPGPSDAS